MPGAALRAGFARTTGESCSRASVARDVGGLVRPASVARGPVFDPPPLAEPRCRTLFPRERDARGKVRRIRGRGRAARGRGIASDRRLVSSRRPAASLPSSVLRRCRPRLRVPPPCSFRTVDRKTPHASQHAGPPAHRGRAFARVPLTFLRERWTAFTKRMHPGPSTLAMTPAQRLGGC